MEEHKHIETITFYLVGPRFFCICQIIALEGKREKQRRWKIQVLLLEPYFSKNKQLYLDIFLMKKCMSLLSVNDILQQCRKCIAAFDLMTLSFSFSELIFLQN